MNQLKLVWELEKYNSMIDDCNKNLKELEDSAMVRNMARKVNELESMVNLKNEKILDNNKEIIRLERRLKEQDYTKNKMEKELYDGSITDLKQLERLTVDKERTLELIDKIESTILQLMDENDALESNYTKLKTEYHQLKNEIIKTEEENNEIIKVLNNKLHKAEGLKGDIIPKIDEKILKRYNATRIKRGKGIVIAYNDICSGCNMRIPTYLMQDLKNQTKIIYCESCGRLLYYKEDHGK